MRQMRTTFFVVLLVLVSTVALAQQPQGQRGGAAVGQLPQGGRGAPPVIQGPPAGVQPLPLDLFLSKNFYKDQALWMDKRYYRCNTSNVLAEIAGRTRGGAANATWGNCDSDVSRESILSPYPYKTAKEHYEALLA